MNQRDEDKIFKAISDNKRRRILHFLSTNFYQMNINEISSHFSESRQGITKHIKILERSGLISIRKEGRESICEAHPEKLAHVQRWVNYYEKFWEDSLADLTNYLND